MSWKCVCKEENNADESKICSNCGRTKPKYLGIKLDLTSTEKMNNEQKAVWYLMIAHDHLLESAKYEELFSEKLKGIEPFVYEKLKENDPDVSRFKDKVEANCEKCLQLLEKANSLSSDAQFKDGKDFIQNIPSIKSSCYFNLGSVCFSEWNYGKAIEHYQASYDSDHNQVSIYNIAMATINLPTEGGSGVLGALFSSKKKQETQTAIKTKREQEINLLMKTIKFAPFSKLGIKSARRLMKDYDLKDIDI